MESTISLGTCFGETQEPMGLSSYDNYVTNRGADMGMSSKAQMMMAATKASGKQRARQMLDPAATIRNRYGLAIVNTPDGDLASEDRANALLKICWLRFLLRFRR